MKHLPPGLRCTHTDGFAVVAGFWVVAGFLVVVVMRS